MKILFALFELVIILIVIIFLLYRISMQGEAADCPRFMVSSIGECDATFCKVQFTNGLFGKAKRPVKVLDVVEVCGGGRGF